MPPTGQYQSHAILPREAIVPPGLVGLLDCPIAPPRAPIPDILPFRQIPGNLFIPVGLSFDTGWVPAAKPWLIPDIGTTRFLPSVPAVPLGLFGLTDPVPTRPKRLIPDIGTARSSQVPLFVPTGITGWTDLPPKLIPIWQPPMMIPELPIIRSFAKYVYVFGEDLGPQYLARGLEAQYVAEDLGPQYRAETL